MTSSTCSPDSRYVIDWYTTHACPVDHLSSKKSCKLSNSQHGVNIDLSPLSNGKTRLGKYYSSSIGRNVVLMTYLSRCHVLISIFSETKKIYVIPRGAVNTRRCIFFQKYRVCKALARFYILLAYRSIRLPKRIYTKLLSCKIQSLHCFVIFTYCYLR